MMNPKPQGRIEMTIMFSVGPWGGVYLYWGFSKRICLGWFAFTFIPMDDDIVLGAGFNDDR